MSHSIHCPLTDICIHYNSDWSGEAVIAYRNIEIRVVARSLILGIPIITKYPSPGAAIDQAVISRAVSLAVERYLKRRFESELEGAIDSITDPLSHRVVCALRKVLTDITFPDTDDEKA